MGSNKVVLVFPSNFPPYISSKRNNTLEDLLELADGYVEPLRNEHMAWKEDLHCSRLLKELLKKKTTEIYCNEDGNSELVNRVLALAADERIHSLFGTVIIIVREKVFTNWYNKFNTFLPTYDNNFHKQFFKTQQKIALMKMGRNSIINNYLVKTFAKRLETIC